MIKKIGITVLAVLVVIIAIVVVRTALFTSKQIKAEPAAPITIDGAKAAERLSKAVGFKTISHQDPAKFEKAVFLDFHAFLARSFPKAHGVLKKEVINGYSLLYTWKGKNPSLKPIVLMGHMDVVPIESGTEGKWTQPPFSGKIADGFIWGRGTLDVKENVTGLLEAVEYLAEKGFKPSRTVYLSFGHDEEIGGEQGAKKIAGILEKRGVKVEFVLDEGGSITDGIVKGINAPVALLGIAEKGYLSIELSVECEGGHSSMPPRHTGVAILSKAITRLDENPFPNRIDGPTRLMLENLGPEMPFGNRIALANLWLLGGLIKSQLSKAPSMAAALHTTTAPTMFQGSPKENVLPSRPTAVVNFRILPGESIKSVMGYVQKTIDDPRVKLKIVGSSNEPSPVSNIQSPAYTSIASAIKQLFPGAVVSPYLVLGGTDSKHFVKLSESVFRFIPVTLKTEDLKRMHGTNERISLDAYDKHIKFFILLIQKTAK